MSQETGRLKTIPINITHEIITLLAQLSTIVLSRWLLGIAKFSNDWITIQQMLDKSSTWLKWYGGYHVLHQLRGSRILAQIRR